MATCKDCLHNAVCDMPIITDGRRNADNCGQFKNKADYAEVKYGEWITLEAEIGLYSCSLCGHKILRAECNYCPNCGAKMDGGKTDEELCVWA